MAFDVVGNLLVVYETKQVSAKFSKREFVLEVADGKYPQTVLFQATGDRCGILDDFRIGDEVRVTFNLRGREWKSPQGEVKYFNSLDVWKLEGAGDVRSNDRRRERERETDRNPGPREPMYGGSTNSSRRDFDDPLAPPPNDDDLPF